MARTRIRRPLVALVVLLAALAVGYVARAVHQSHSQPAPRLTSSATAGNATTTAVPLSSLPPQATRTVRLIQSGGPFPYPHNDGVVFHNAEHHLPARPDGYYHEYTVITPGSDTRGARRIVTGEDGEFYYTGDHYAHFVRVDIST